MRPGDPKILIEKFQLLGQTIALAESLTGGLVGALMVSVPGSSSVFTGSVVAYQLRIKKDVLGIPEDILQGDGVNAQTAYQMACAARKLFSSTWGLGLTGLAGPKGGTKFNPVGTVYLGLCGPINQVQRYFFSGSRQRIRQQAAWLALALVGSCLDRSINLGLS